MKTTNRTGARRASVRAAFCGMIAALSVVLMLSGSLIPVFTYVSPLAAAVLLLPVMLSFGSGSAWLVWGITALLSLLLGLDREAAFFYLFFGWWPILKWPIDRHLHRKPLRLTVKALIFTAAAGAMYALLTKVLGLDAILQEFADMQTAGVVGFFILLVLCMLLFDALLWPLCFLYNNRIYQKLKFLHGL